MHHDVGGAYVTGNTNTPEAHSAISLLSLQMLLTVIKIHGCSFCKILSSKSRWKDASFSTISTNLASECISGESDVKVTQIAAQLTQRLPNRRKNLTPTWEQICASVYKGAQIQTDPEPPSPNSCASLPSLFPGPSPSKLEAIQMLIGVNVVRLRLA